MDGKWTPVLTFPERDQYETPVGAFEMTRCDTYAEALRVAETHTEANKSLGAYLSHVIKPNGEIFTGLDEGRFVMMLYAPKSKALRMGIAPRPLDRKDLSGDRIARAPATLLYPQAAAARLIYDGLTNVSPELEAEVYWLSKLARAEGIAGRVSVWMDEGYFYVLSATGESLGVYQRL